MITRLRTQQLTIDLPRSTAEPWVRLIVQRVELDEAGKELNVVDRWGELTKPMSAFATDLCQYTDPLNPPEHMISGVGMASAITSFASAWIVEKYGGVIQPNGDILMG